MHHPYPLFSVFPLPGGSFPASLRYGARSTLLAVTAALLLWVAVSACQSSRHDDLELDHVPRRISQGPKGLLYSIDQRGDLRASFMRGESAVLASSILPPGESSTGLAADAEGRVYLSLSRQGRILRLEKNGEPRDILEGLDQPVGLSLDNSGRLYIAEQGTGRLLCWDEERGLQEAAANLPGVSDVVWTRAGLFAATQDGLTLITPQGGRRLLAAQDRAIRMLARAWGDAAYMLTDAGLWRVTAQGDAAPLMLGEPGISAMSGDRDGNLLVCETDPNRLRLLRWPWPGEQ